MSCDVMSCFPHRVQANEGVRDPRPLQSKGFYIHIHCVQGQGWSLLENGRTWFLFCCLRNWNWGAAFTGGKLRGNDDLFNQGGENTVYIVHSDLILNFLSTSGRTVKQSPICPIHMIHPFVSFFLSKSEELTDASERWFGRFREYERAVIQASDGLGVIGGPC